MRRYCLGRLHLEGNLFGKFFCGGCLARLLDRPLVVVETEEPRFGKGAGHQQGGDAVATADVCHRRTTLELLDAAGECRQPLLNEEVFIAGAEEACGSTEEALRPLVPAHAFTAAEGPADMWLVPHRGSHEIANRRQEEGAVLLRQHRSLLRLHGKAFVRWIVGHVA